MTPHQSRVTTRARRLVLGSTTALAVAASALATAPPGASAAAVATASRTAPTTVTAPDDRTWDRTYFSVAPTLREEDSAPAPRALEAPQPPPTKGFVTGKVVGPKGSPIRNALVMGLRFSDFGLPVDLTEESRVLTRTGKSGGFRLRQLKEPYLIRVCDEAKGSDGECATEPADKRYTPSYVGPDGRSDSWLQQTRLFQPQKPRRGIGTVTVGPTAVLEGRFKGGANQAVYLLRMDDSIAEQAFTDGKGNYRFEVAAGVYRVEADHHPGLRTDSTVPGHRSGPLELRAGRTEELSFRTRHAATVRGQVTSGGDPLGDQFLAIINARGEFAAGVVTNGAGRYVVGSLKPGRYTIRTSATFAEHVAAVKPVTLERRKAKAVNFQLQEGATLRFSTLDVGGDGLVDAELRNSAGRVMKVYQGDPADEQNAQVRWRGLPGGTYHMYVRRMNDPFADPAQTEFPWATRAVTLGASENENLGVVALDQPTINLAGNLPKRSQVKITPVPQDVWLREAHTNGDQSTPMALNWTEKAKGDGTYLARGLVPGTYTALVTTGYRTRVQPTATEGNIAARHHSVSVTPSDLSANFPAPKGAILKGKVRYEANKRPVIAPIGYRVFDGGDESWLFPLVSEPQKYGRGFRVARIHQGKAVGRILDLTALYAEHEGVLIPDTLVSSARLAEAGTPYWFTSKARSLRLKKGKVLNLGFVNIVLHGRAPVTVPAGGGGGGGGGGDDDGPAPPG